MVHLFRLIDLRLQSALLKLYLVPTTRTEVIMFSVYLVKLDLANDLCAPFVLPFLQYIVVCFISSNKTLSVSLF